MLKITSTFLFYLSVMYILHTFCDFYVTNLVLPKLAAHLTLDSTWHGAFHESWFRNIFINLWSDGRKIGSQRVFKESEDHPLLIIIRINNLGHLVSALLKSPCPPPHLDAFHRLFIVSRDKQICKDWMHQDSIFD